MYIFLCDYFYCFSRNCLRLCGTRRLFWQRGLMGSADEIDLSSHQKPCVAQRSSGRRHRRVILLSCVFVLLRVPGRVTNNPLFFWPRRKEEPCVIRFVSEQPRCCLSWQSFSGAPSGLFRRPMLPLPRLPVVLPGRPCTPPSTMLHQETPSSFSSVEARVRLTLREQAEERLLSRRI